MRRRENAAGLNIAFAQGDLFAAVEGMFDVIVCNPPYLTEEDMLSLQREVRYEPPSRCAAARTGWIFTGASPANCRSLAPCGLF